MTDWRQFVREHLPPLRLVPAREAEIVEELAQQLEQSCAAAIARGASESVARARAESQIPDWRKLAAEILHAESPSQAATHNLASHIPEKIRYEASPEQIRKHRGGSMFVDFLQDLRYALRMLRKSPGFTAVAILTIALAIGANTAIFSVVDAVLLHRLPYRDPDRLVSVTDFIPRQGNQVVLDADYFAMRAQNHVFEDLTAYQGGGDFTLTGAGDAVRVTGALVSASFFHTIGVTPRLGREFTSEEDTYHGPHAAILMDSFWRNRFSVDPAVLGRQISLDGTSYTIVGVMPREFQFLSSTHTDLLIPYQLRNEGLALHRSIALVNILARLRPGITIPMAVADLNAINQQLAASRPGGWAKMFVGVQARVISLHDKLVGNVRTALLVLIGGVGFVLLIACANVANLQLARASAREPEMAIRGALGASRVRIVRQLLTENCLVALLGGGAGLFLAYALTVAIRTLGPKDVPFLPAARLNPLALAFTLVLSLGTGVIFGLFPALSSLRVSLEQTLKEAAARSSGGIVARRSQKILMVFETALALALFVGAGLLLRTFLRITSVPPGFSSQGVLTAKISLPPNTYRNDEQQRAFFDQLAPRLASLPGVESAGLGVLSPLEGMYYRTGISFNGQAIDRVLLGSSTNVNVVSPGYFPALRIPLVAGRNFDEHDAANSARVVIVNQAFVRKYLPSVDPVGQRFQMASDPAVQIVGVVADVKQMSLASDVDPMTYEPAEQSPSNLMTLVLRTTGNPLQLVSAVRAEVAAIDKNLPLYSIQTMDEVISGEVASQRFNAWLLGMFAGLAVVLAAIGIYGVMAYSVTQRTREIGIRMALGAAPEKVRLMILRQGLWLAVAGIFLGLAAAFALTRFLRNLLFGVRPTDPLTFALVSVILIAAAFAACWIPARRASKVDPLVALRYE